MNNCDNCKWGDPKTVICCNPKYRCITYDHWEKPDHISGEVHYLRQVEELCHIWPAKDDTLSQGWNTNLQVEPEERDE